MRIIFISAAWIIFIGVMMCLATVTHADLAVTSKDVEVRFPDAGAAEKIWYSVEIAEVSYWQEPIGSHNAKTRIGKQIWEGLLQKEEPELGKVRFSITILSLPKVDGKTSPARRMELHFRVRDIVKGTLRGVSDWSEYGFVDIIGKPGDPVHP